jgi:prevent-host-death family protein
MTVIRDIGAARLEDLVKQVIAGNDVLITERDRPVARLVAASEMSSVQGPALQIRSLQGHRVLTPVISQNELADELFGQP